MTSLKIIVFLSLSVFSEFTFAVSEQECAQVFQENYQRLQQTQNRASAFMGAFNEGFSSRQGFEECPQILQSGSSFYQQAIILETQITRDIENGQTFPPQDLERFFSRFPSYNSGSSAIIERNNQNFSSSQQRCTPVDYRDQMPPIRDQTDVGWCYAHTAADVISFKRGENVYAIDLALQFNRYKNIQRQRNGEEALNLTMLDGCDPSSERCFNEGGTGIYALALAANNGVCRESALPSTSSQSREYGEILQRIEEIEEFVNSASNQDDAHTQAASICSGDLGHFIADAFPLALVSDIADILQQDEIQNGFFELAEASCENNRIESPGDVTYATVDNEGAARNIELIHEQLSNNNIAGIGYNPNLFSTIETAITSGGHESTVVGRRWNESTQTCQFLVRNTMGESCDNYHAHVQCERGHYWANENDLLENIGQVYYIQ